MSVKSAKEYITRMREDKSFHKVINDYTDEQANWEFLKVNGYEFTLQEFKLAQEEIYHEYGITPL
jgi:predicted ribosomally synthesized peptide with nif11-like leader